MILNGVLHVTGEHDTGKTTFALECGAGPGKIAFFDDDIKGRATVDGLRRANIEFGLYQDLAALTNTHRKPIDFHNAVLDLIEKIKPEQFDAIVWDTWTHFAKTCRLYVKAFPNEFRNPNEWATQGRIKGAEMNAEGVAYEASIISRLSRLAPTVVLVTHLKDQYVQVDETKAVKSGKEIPASSKALNRVPRMRMWLRQNPSGRPVPIGLFLKRLDKKIVVDGKIRTICVVPRKIVPRENDGSLWDTIWWYWDHPVGMRPPLPEETPDEFELSILDGTLTRDQRRTFELLLKIGVGETGEVESKELTLAEQIKALEQEGKTMEEIASEIERPVEIVKAVLSQ